MKYPVRTVILTAFLGTMSHAADYAGLHNELIGFYRYQRAGLSSGNPHNPFYTQAGSGGAYPHASDSYNGADLSGGWYDAGDFVKFGLPLGYATYCLLKGYDVFPGVYDDKDSWQGNGVPNGIPDVLDEGKVATDYIMKAVVSSAAIVMDVGNAQQDHQQLTESGYANSDRLRNRQVYPATGADVPGLYAAALALMSKLYAAHDQAYSRQCLAKAKEAFAFCTRNQKLTSAMQKDWNNGGAPYYGTETWADKMACGAIELYRATGEQAYLVWARDLMARVAQHYYVLGYANCGDLAAFELCRAGETSLAGNWFADLSFALNRVVVAQGLLVTGAFVNSDWGVCRDAANAAFSAALAYMIKGDNRYRDFAYQQINWVAGFAPYSRSYLVRYNGGPQNPHHRNDITLGRKLRGGIMSGPNPQGPFDPSHPESANWVFSDVADKFTNTEVALDYNAGAVGAVAFIRYYDNPPPGLLRIEQELKVTPDKADFNAVPSVRISMILEKPVSWRIVATGRNSGASRAFTGSGTTVSAAWDGSADSGAFQPGELVDLRFVNDNIAEYHLSRASALLLIESLKDTPFGAGDVLVDDVDDGNLTNRLNGVWSAFSDSSEEVSQGTSPVPIVYVSSAGKDATKAVLARLTVTPGAAHPYAGMRTAFARGSVPVSIGQARSIVFDVKSADTGATFRVELEEPGVPDRAYFGSPVALAGTAWSRIRIPVPSLQLPSWTARKQGLNTGAVTAIRFVRYGEGSVRLTIDNLHVEGLTIGAAPVRSTGGRHTRDRSVRLVAGNRSALLDAPPRAVWAAVTSLAILNAEGSTLLECPLRATAGETVYVSGLDRLAPGAYFVAVRGRKGLLQSSSILLRPR